MEQLIYEKSKAGRRAEILPKAQVPQKDLKSLIPANLLRKEAGGNQVQEGRQGMPQEEGGGGESRP